MAQPMKASILLAVDNSDARRGLKETQSDFDATGAAARSAEPHVQRLVEVTTGLGRAQAANRNRGEDIAAYGAQLDSLRAKYNPLFAVTQRYRQEVAEIREAQRLGAISTDEMTAAISRQRQATLAAIDSIKGRTALAGLPGLNDNGARFRRQNLTYQLFDIGQTAAMGMNPAMIMAQQGPQIVQLYAGQGGVNMALKDFGSILGGLTRLINPVTLGIGGLTAAVGLGAAAYGSYLSSTKAVETAAAGLGRTVAGTAAEMRASAEAGAAAAGISVAAARSMQTAFLRTGKIGSENFEKLIGLSDDFAATMGMASAEAGDALADLFSDPAKAADTLSRQYNLIDAATARQVRNLSAQNRLIEAQALILDQLPGKLADAGEASTRLGRAWKAMREDAANLFGAIGAGVNYMIDGPSDEKRLERLREQQAELYERIRRPDDGLLAGAVRGQMYRDVAEIELQIGILTSRLNAAETKRAEAEARQRVTAASTIADASPALSTINQVEAYQNQIAALQSGIGSLTPADIDAGEGDRLNKALEAKERALDGLLTKQQRLNDLDRLDIQIANERNPVLKAELEARRKRLELQGQEIDQSTADAEVQRAYSRVIESTIASGKAQIDQINAETEIRAGLNGQVTAGALSAADANRILQEELQLRPLIAAAAEAEGEEKRRLEGIVTGLKEAYAAAAEAARAESNRDAVRTRQESIAGLKLQLGLIGATSAERRRAIAVFEEQQKLTREGIALDSAAAQSRLGLAAAEAELATAIERAEASRERALNHAESMEQLRAEAALIGDSETARRRELAVLEEMQAIRREGLALGGEEAQQRIQNVRILADETSELERMRDAWGEVKSAGESAIDAIFNFEDLRDGDFGSIFDNLTSSLGQSLMDLTINNPLKNNWLGTNYGTLGDVMNRPASGLFSAFTDQSVGAMNVRAASVIVNGGIASSAGGLGGLLAGLRASNDNRPLSAFREAIAAIESGGRYGALGPVTASGDRAYGRYQVMGANVGPWTEQALGYAMTPSSFLTSPQAQDAVFDKIFGGYLSRYGNANDAASTWFTGRPLSRGASAADILGTTGASYVQKFNTALSQLTDTTGLATDGLGTLGNGLNEFGGLFSSYQPSGGTGGGLLSALGSLFGVGGTSQLDIAKANVLAGTAGLYDRGGYTGPGGVHEPAGVVHKGEVVWSQGDIARAGGVRVVEAMRLGKRGYAKGGVVESLPFAVPASNDNAGSPVRPSIAISISLEGAQGDREIEQKSRQAAYAGMKQALDEYDAQFNDKVAAAVDRPRWR